MKKIISILLPLLLVTGVFADSAFNTSLRYGSRGQDVREMQEFLIDQGYLTGSVTGNFYALTLKAVKQFQAKNGLSASGFWGPLTRQKAIELTDLKASDEEATNTPVVLPQTQIQAQPAVQYIYTPAPTTIAPVVDTSAQQRQAINNEYDLKVAQLNSKVLELSQMNSKITDLAIFWNSQYSLHPESSGLPDFVTTQNQQEMIKNVFDGMLSLNRYSMNTPNELTVRIANYTNNINNQISQLEIEKQQKLQKIQ